MKKMTAWLLALLMMAMPFAGLAETENTVPPIVEDLAALLSQESAQDYYADAIAAGRRVTTHVTLSNVSNEFSGEAAVDQVIADVLNALDVTVYQQGDEGSFSLGMKQSTGEVAELLTFAGATAGEDAYIASNLIGGTIVISADEVVPVTQRLLDMFVMIGFMEEEEAEEIKAQLPEMMEMIKAELAAAVPAADIDFTKLDYSAITKGLTMIIGKLGFNSVEMQPKNCDTAVSEITITLTPAEVNELVAMMFQFVKDNPDLANALAAELDFENTYAMEFSGVEGETITFTEFLDKTIEEIKAEEIVGGDVTARILLGEDSMPVAAEIILPIAVAAENAESGEQEITVQNLTINYTRLTMNDSVAHSVVMKADDVDMTMNVVVKEKTIHANLAVAEDGETMLEMKMDTTDRSAENLIAADVVIEMNIYDDEESVSLKFAMTSDTVINGVDFTETDAITIGVNGKDYATVNVTCATSDAGASIMTGNVVRPAELNDNDFANWFVTVYNSLFTWLSSAMYALPASVMNLLTTGY